MKKGDIVKLSQAGLDWIYKGNPAWRERAETYRYMFWGYPRDEAEKRHGIVTVKRLTSHSFLSFHKRFLELAEDNPNV